MNPASYYQHLLDLYSGAACTRSPDQIDEETGLYTGWDESPFTVIENITLK